MVRREPVQSLTQEFISGEMNRREFMKRAAALGLTTAGVGAGLGSQVGTAAATSAAYTPELVAQRAAARSMNLRRLSSPLMNACVRDWTGSRSTIL